jgi:hypothetical protein
MTDHPVTYFWHIGSGGNTHTEETWLNLSLKGCYNEKRNAETPDEAAHIFLPRF